MQDLKDVILSLVPSDGSAVGNISLRSLVADKLDRDVDEAEYFAARDTLVAAGKLAKGQGRGGSVRLTAAVDVPVAPVASSAPAATPTAAKTATSGKHDILAYRHGERRTNNPEVGLVKPENDPYQPKTEWAYDPHIDPALQFDVGRSQVEKLIDDALASGDKQRMHDALAELRRMSEPYLNWAGKAEHTSFEVDTVSLHVHERIDPASILAAVRKSVAEAKAGKAFQMGLFEAPFETVPLREAIDFYRHDRGWANRLVAGDSLLVMNSLLKKESMAGQVQMVYMDPPYGIKYGSNFQPFVNKRDVKDGRDEDLTQEPEMIKAFRDTWELGIHSYLTYLRDRLVLARELLHESGSIFIQIGDENVHLVRALLDEVFGIKNFCAQIAFKSMMPLESGKIESVFDYVVWYAKDNEKAKYRNLWIPKNVGGDAEFVYADMDGGYRRMTPEEIGDIAETLKLQSVFKRSDLSSSGYTESCTFPIAFAGQRFETGGKSWRTTQTGVGRLIGANRLFVLGKKLYYKLYHKDFGLRSQINCWDDTIAFDKKTYVVETVTTVIRRCMLMTTDPGDLVFDPTCGSGTTAFVAEQWGRRWATCDTSRVAIALAKQRLATSTFDYYRLRYPNEGLKGGFVYKTVPHVMLKSIANNPEIDQIYEKQHPAIDKALADLNAALHAAAVPTPFAVTEGGRKGQKLNFRVNDALLEWEIPCDFQDAWPATAKPAFTAFHAARQTMQRHMDASIKNHAEQEILYDKPEPDTTKLRVSGPFTVEAVPFPSVLSLDEVEVPAEADATVARSGESSRQNQWRDELLKTGIRGKGGQFLKFASLEAMPGTRYLHVTGVLDTGERVVVSFGPEHAALEQRQVSKALDEVENLRPKPKFVIFAAFTFDPEAAKDIDETNWPGVTMLKAQMNTDLLTADLKKARSSNQSFWLMGQPEVELRKDKDGKYVVEVHGFDYFDTVKGELVSGGKGKIAVWLLDTDYDSRSVFPRQLFFPMAGDKDGWNKLSRNLRAELNEDRLAAYHGTVSLPFDAGDNRQIAVKIVDDRGIESLKVLPLD